MYSVYGLLIFEIIFILHTNILELVSYIKIPSDTVYISELVPVSSANMLL